MSIARFTEFRGLKAGDRVRVNAQCRIAECRGQVGEFLYGHAEQPGFGSPDEYIVTIDRVARPLERHEFDPLKENTP